MADELGIPLMFGWMCCNQWEKWPQWDDEDNRVAQDSLRSQIQMLRPHASVFVWANGATASRLLPCSTATTPSCRPALAERRRRHRVLDDQRATGERVWDGIQMAGPYSWRPPSYWFSGRYAATRGATAEQGDNEHIPPFASLKKFIPAGQAVADQRRLVLPRRIEPEQRCADQHSARRQSPLRRRPTSARNSPARRSLRTTSRRAPNSRRSPRMAGTTTR